MARMAHHQAAFRQAVRRKPGNSFAKSAFGAKRIGAGEGRIGGDAERLRARARNSRLSQSSSSAFRSVRRAVQRQRAAALAHPGLRRESLAVVQHRLAHLRKQMHVLMAVDEIRRAAEGGRRRPRTALAISRGQRGQRRAAAACASAQHRRRAGETRRRAAARKPRVSGLNGAVSVTCRPIATRGRAALSIGERIRLGAREARRHHHHRGGIEPAAHDQVADRRVDAGRDAVIVGAQPDAPACARRMTRRSHCPFGRRARRAGFALAPPSRCARRRNRPAAALISDRILPMYSPSTPIMMSCTPPSTIRPTTTDG